MLLTFLLAFGAFAAPPPRDHGYRPAFHHADCARYFLRRVAEVRAVALEGVPERARAHAGRAPVEGASHEFDFDHVPDFIWFTSDPGAPADETAARIAAAAGAGETSARFRRGQLRWARADADRPLSGVERAALGVDGPGELRLVDLRGAAVRDDHALRVRWEAHGAPAGGFELDAAGVEVGYTNSVYEWQYLMLGAMHDGRNGGPGASFKPRVADFFDTEVRALFTRTTAAGRRFGYFLTRAEVAPGRPVLELEVLALSQSARLAAGAEDVVFPRAADREPGQINLRLSDLGLRVLMTSAPARE